ncbi:TldD/PmbA family protein, partial [Ilyobacter sp.]|uniref:TldD/PmbA family protein n=1 Tax=Ilyobacter sp. TaxID=3100343 RepID=UPI0035660116
MLDKISIEDILIHALSTGGDFAEVFIEEKFNTGLFMIDGSIEKSLSGKDFGVGIRIFKGLFSVYAYTNEVTRDSLIETAKKAAEAITGSKGDIIINLIKQDIENRHKIILPPDKVGKNKKVDIMKRAHQAASSYDESISQVRISYSDSVQNVMIANSDGLWTEDTRTRSRIGIESVASKEGDMQTGSYRPGALKGFEFFENINVEECGIEASRIAKTMLNAKYCPSGKFPVIIDNEFGGVIFHEA